MSRITYKLVQGDRRPIITVQLTDKATRTPVDLSAGTTTVTLKFREKNDTTVLQTITGTKIAGYAGLVQFAWPANALEVDEGTYEGEISISFDGQVHTVLDLITFKLREDF